MTIKMPWRAEYWPKIIDELTLKNKKEKDNGTWPYFYDRNRILREQLEISGEINSMHRNNNYVYVNDSRIIVSIIEAWNTFDDYSLKDFTRRMKAYERAYMHKVIYDKRKEEFDALDSETNS